MLFVLSIIALISAVIMILAKMSENSATQYIFKPLTMGAIIVLACLSIDSPPTFYQQMIIAGLLLSTVGDVFLINPRRFVQGLISFLLAHVVFAAAFYDVPHLPSLFFYLGYVAIFLAVLWKRLGKLKIPVTIYATALAAMSWFALSRYLATTDIKSLCAFFGSVFFLVSDSMLGYKKFRNSFAFAEPLVLSTYFIAQWLIAVSI